MAKKAIGAPPAAESAARSAGSFPTARNMSTLHEFKIAFLVTINIRSLDIFERKVSPFFIAQFGHSLQESCVNRELAGLNADEANTQHLSLRLRPQRERPRP